MRRNFILLSIINLVLISGAAFSQSFRIVPLGVKGGIDESNLSAYMVAASGTNNYICLDAGTLYYGIEKAVNNKVFPVSAEQVLRQYIKGYFISHAHLDHVSGLIICSPADSSKSIYGLKSCLETIKTHYFTWDSWANFADEGERPTLKKYNYQVLTPNTPINVKNTWMQVTAFPLSHFNLASTAFLVKSNDAYILYLGDTGPDEVEHSHSLHELWQTVAPLIKNKKLKAIMIETSFPNEQPDKSLFGHLTPHWLMTEMNDLANLTGHNELKGFNIIVTHVKPPQDEIEKIKTQLKAENSLHLNLIFPEQGKAIDL